VRGRSSGDVVVGIRGGTWKGEGGVKKERVTKRGKGKRWMRKGRSRSETREEKAGKSGGIWGGEGGVEKAGGRSVGGMFGRSETRGR